MNERLFLLTIIFHRRLKRKTHELSCRHFFLGCVSFFALSMLNGCTTSQSLSDQMIEIAQSEQKNIKSSDQTTHFSDDNTLQKTATNEQITTPDQNQTDDMEQSILTTDASHVDDHTMQTDSSPPKRTSLFSFSRKAKNPTLQQKNIESKNDQLSNDMRDNKTMNNTLLGSEAPSTDKTNDENVQITPVRNQNSQKQGSIMRLFGQNKGNKPQSPNIQKDTLALAEPLKKGPRDYNDELPGVRPNAGIVIQHRTTQYDDTDIDANESDSDTVYTLASVGIYGRSLPNGLKVARKDVEVACLKPQLITLLKNVERRFGKPVIITSGYRSPSHNRKVNGAKRSLHMSCSAADIQVPGVNKMEVANYVRRLPGRGGVGTYCHQSIHVDIGPKRDWNWSCSAKK
ncbi:hypothetical protein MEG_00451 [Bartonella tamiae Th307]|uniref:Murein endopeptidase K n=2 Tax=Bartonella tamiae TaxID=373638 RepID=J1JWB4_9HYPH|nr:D-Ala-D-Ala carboxypeptidase family metallohydrolase [Bartonella tamiae]EJF88880.1 hypothetical protein ME5_01431 [Bartonella tamiae Th239]EJF94870.1 hypothetical protein MEG_00451 [Bartonella tamiae Th307]